MGISLDTTTKTEEAENVEEEEEGGTPGGTLAAADVLDKFRISDYDCIETDILDSAYSGKYITKYFGNINSITTTCTVTIIDKNTDD